MGEAARKVGFWVVVAIVAVIARPAAQALAVGPLGDRLPGLRQLVAT